jgi:alpha-galactosidase
MYSFQSLAGFSSAFHNPFLGIVSPETTETNGEAYGISLVYTGSFPAMVERNSTGLDRVQIGMNPLHLSWTIAPGGSFHSPEAVAVYSAQGLGGMSRSFHRLYRDHLSRSSWTHKQRPVLINHWEATEFDYDGDIIYRVAKAGSDLGCKLVSRRIFSRAKADDPGCDGRCLVRQEVPP